MEITLTLDSIIKFAAVLGACGAIIGCVVKAVRWMDRQKQQDAELASLRETHNDDIDALKQELALIVEAQLACLKGLQEQGCNGPVSEMISKVEQHLNQKAHQ